MRFSLLILAALSFGIYQSSLAQPNTIKGIIVPGFIGYSITIDNVPSRSVLNWGCVSFTDIEDRDEDRSYFESLPDHHLHFAVLNNLSKNNIIWYPRSYNYDGEVLEVPSFGIYSMYYAFVNGEGKPDQPVHPSINPNPPPSIGAGKYTLSSMNGKTVSTDQVTIPHLKIRYKPADYGKLSGITKEEIEECLSDMKNEVPLLLPVIYEWDGTEYVSYYQDITLKYGPGQLRNFDLVFYKESGTWYAAAVHIK